MKRFLYSSLTLLVAVLSAVVVTQFTAGRAGAASLTRITGFGSNPGGLNMWLYRPDGLPGNAPLVVAMHGCTQTANDYYANSGWKKYADLHHFAVVFPERIDSAAFPSNCFQWFQESHITRGQGQALSVAQMVGHATRTYQLDATRVYVTGLSAGGAMAAVMLATYPDLFTAGSIVSGLPYRCSPPASTSTCQYSGVDKTPAAWGDLVRNAYPGYTGRRPRVAIWHGQSDAVVVPKNGIELRDQWTNVLGVSQTPVSSESLPAGTTLEKYGADMVRLYKIAGAGHGTPVDPGTAADQCGTAGAYFLDSICSAYRDTRFFGLDGSVVPPTGTPTPTPTISPTVAPVCVTASNYAHTTAGRAHQSGGYTYANGSNDSMGLWNTFTIHTLKQTGPGYWIVADGQCA
ncbi:PHB depolymerase family esterase [Sphaerisporangium flaviroseum]|uniref:PHB depolymerase family esterase n=1 Tax=Sphaerisporangium flaviroseum TaxID=509199 RepID=A0ABP7J3B6_9ACTN